MNTAGRRVYLARHAQPVSGPPGPGRNHQFPDGDPGVTELGLRQADHLGRHLQQTGFQGAIYASPYLRALTTAAHVACRLGRGLRVEARVQEIAFGDRPNTAGQSLVQLKARFPGQILNDSLPFPWVIGAREDRDAVAVRVGHFLAWLLAETAGDALIVAHGASILAMTRDLGRRAGITVEMEDSCPPWNCALSVFEAGEDGRWHLVTLNDHTFMPAEIVTSNEQSLLAGPSSNG